MTRSIHATAAHAATPSPVASLFRYGVAGVAAGVATFKLFLEACRDGLAAMHRYDQMRARGVPHETAILNAFNATDRR